MPGSATSILTSVVVVLLLFLCGIASALPCAPPPTITPQQGEYEGCDYTSVGTVTLTMNAGVETVFRNAVFTGVTIRVPLMPTFAFYSLRFENVSVALSFRISGSNGGELTFKDSTFNLVEFGGAQTNANIYFSNIIMNSLDFQFSMGDTNLTISDSSTVDDFELKGKATRCNIAFLSSTLQVRGMSISDLEGTAIYFEDATVNGLVEALGSMTSSNITFVSSAFEGSGRFHVIGLQTLEECEFLVVNTSFTSLSATASPFRISPDLEDSTVRFESVTMTIRAIIGSQFHVVDMLGDLIRSRFDVKDTTISAVPSSGTERVRGINLADVDRKSTVAMENATIAIDGRGGMKACTKTYCESATAVYIRSISSDSRVHVRSCNFTMHLSGAKEGARGLYLHASSLIGVAEKPEVLLVESTTATLKSQQGLATFAYLRGTTNVVVTIVDCHATLESSPSELHSSFLELRTTSGTLINVSRPAIATPSSAIDTLSVLKIEILVRGASINVEHLATFRSDESTVQGISLLNMYHPGSQVVGLESSSVVFRNASVSAVITGAGRSAIFLGLGVDVEHTTLALVDSDIFLRSNGSNAISGFDWGGYYFNDPRLENLTVAYTRSEVHLLSGSSLGVDSRIGSSDPIIDIDSKLFFEDSIINVTSTGSSSTASLTDHVRLEASGMNINVERSHFVVSAPEGIVEFINLGDECNSTAAAITDSTVVLSSSKDLRVVNAAKLRFLMIMFQNSHIAWEGGPSSTTSPTSYAAFVYSTAEWSGLNVMFVNTTMISTRADDQQALFYPTAGGNDLSISLHEGSSVVFDNQEGGTGSSGYVMAFFMHDLAVTQATVTIKDSFVKVNASNGGLVKLSGRDQPWIDLVLENATIDVTSVASSSRVIDLSVAAHQDIKIHRNTSISFTCFASAILLRSMAPIELQVHDSHLRMVGSRVSLILSIENSDTTIVGPREVSILRSTLATLGPMRTIGVEVRLAPVNLTLTASTIVAHTTDTCVPVAFRSVARSKPLENGTATISDVYFDVRCGVMLAMVWMNNLKNTSVAVSGMRATIAETYMLSTIVGYAFRIDYTNEAMRFSAEDAHLQYSAQRPAYPYVLCISSSFSDGEATMENVTVVTNTTLGLLRTSASLIRSKLQFKSCTLNVDLSGDKGSEKVSHAFLVNDTVLNATDLVVEDSHFTQVGQFEIFTFQFGKKLTVSADSKLRFDGLTINVTQLGSAGNQVAVPMYVHNTDVDIGCPIEVSGWIASVSVETSSNGASGMLLLSKAGEYLSVHNTTLDLVAKAGGSGVFRAMGEHQNISVTSSRISLRTTFGSQTAFTSLACLLQSRLRDYLTFRFLHSEFDSHIELRPDFSRGVDNSIIRIDSMNNTRIEIANTTATLRIVNPTPLSFADANESPNTTLISVQHCGNVTLNATGSTFEFVDEFTVRNADRSMPGLLGTIADVTDITAHLESISFSYRIPDGAVTSSITVAGVLFRGVCENSDILMSGVKSASFFGESGIYSTVRAQAGAHVVQLSTLVEDTTFSTTGACVALAFDVGSTLDGDITMIMRRAVMEAGVVNGSALLATAATWVWPHTRFDCELSSTRFLNFPTDSVNRLSGVLPLHADVVVNCTSINDKVRFSGNQVGALIAQFVRFVPQLEAQEEVCPFDASPTQTVRIESATPSAAKSSTLTIAPPATRTQLRTRTRSSSATRSQSGSLSVSDSVSPGCGTVSSVRWNVSDLDAKSFRDSGGSVWLQLRLDVAADVEGAIPAFRLADSSSWGAADKQNATAHFSITGDRSAMSGVWLEVSDVLTHPGEGAIDIRVSLTDTSEDGLGLVPVALSTSVAAEIALAVSPSHSLFPCPDLSAAEFRHPFRLTNPKAVVSEEAKSTIESVAVASNMVGSSILSGSATTGALQARAAALAGLSHCRFSHSEPLPVTDSPLGLRIGSAYGGYYRGTLVGNAIFFVGFLAIAALFTLSFWAAGSARSIWDAMGIIHLPGVLVVPISQLMQGTATVATALMFHPHDPIDVPFAIGAYIVLLAITGLLIWKTTAGLHSVVVPRPMVADGNELRVTNPALWFITWLFLSDEKWIDDPANLEVSRGFKEHWQQLYTDFAQGRAWYLGAEMVVSLIVGFLTGLYKEEWCSAISYIMLALLLVQAASAVFYRPYKAPFETAFHIGLSVLTAIAALLILIGSEAESEAVSNTAEILALVIVILASFKLLFDIFYTLRWFYSKYQQWRRRRHARRKQAALELGPRIGPNGTKALEQLEVPLSGPLLSEHKEEPATASEKLLDRLLESAHALRRRWRAGSRKARCVESGERAASDSLDSSFSNADNIQHTHRAPPTKDEGKCLEEPLLTCSDSQPVESSTATPPDEGVRVSSSNYPERGREATSRHQRPGPVADEASPPSRGRRYVSSSSPIPDRRGRSSRTPTTPRDYQAELQERQLRAFGMILENQRARNRSAVEELISVRLTLAEREEQLMHSNGGLQSPHPLARSGFGSPPSRDLNFGGAGQSSSTPRQQTNSSLLL